MSFNHLEMCYPFSADFDGFWGFWERMDRIGKRNITILPFIISEELKIWFPQPFFCFFLGKHKKYFNGKTISWVIEYNQSDQ